MKFCTGAKSKHFNDITIPRNLYDKFLLLLEHNSTGNDDADNLPMFATSYPLPQSLRMKRVKCRVNVSGVYRVYVYLSIVENVHDRTYYAYSPYMYLFSIHIINVSTVVKLTKSETSTNQRESTHTSI